MQTGGQTAAAWPPARTRPSGASGRKSFAEPGRWLALGVFLATAASLQGPGGFLAGAQVAPTIDYSHNMRVLKVPKSVKPGELIYRLKGSDGDPNSQLHFGVAGIHGRALLDVVPTPGSWNEADVYLRSSLSGPGGGDGDLPDGEPSAALSPTSGPELFVAAYNLTIWVADASNKTTQVDSTILVTNDDDLAADPDESAPGEEQRKYSAAITLANQPALYNASDPAGQPLRLPTLASMGRVNFQRPLSPFLSPRHLFSVPESAQPGEPVGQLSVRESSKSDLPVRFELRGRGSDHFAIKYVFGPRGQSKGELVLAQPLDYERQNLFQLKVLALNAWTNTKYDTRNVATLDILIAVGDVQDSAPQFKELPHALRVANNMRPGQLVARVHAEDGDYADQRPVVYALDASLPLASHFDIDKQTGEITLKTAASELALAMGQQQQSQSTPPLQPQLQLVVGVLASELPDPSSYDHLWPPMFARADLPVLLTDVLNEAPQFVGGSLAAQAAGSQGPAAPILRGFLREFTNSHHEGPHSTGGQLVQWYGPDELAAAREPEANQQRLRLAKAQGGRPMVIDLGQGLNGTFELALEGPDAHLFELEPSYPVSRQSIFNLLVAPGANRSLFDFDSGAHAPGSSSNSQHLQLDSSPRAFHLELVARDFGWPQRASSRLRCLVDLLEADDNAPQFDSDLYTFSIFENAQLGQVVGNVRARDLDRAPVGRPGAASSGLLAGPQQRARYTSLSGRDSHLFRLDPDSGLITLEGQLDRERQALFLLLAEARDLSGQAANYTKIVIDVLDVNDNAPAFTQSHYDAVLLPDGSFQQPLVVSATDADEPNSANSQVAYEIIAGNQNEQFTIDSLSGAIYLTGAPQTPGQQQSAAPAAGPIQLPSILSEPILPYVSTRDQRGKIMPGQGGGGAGAATHEIEETTAPTSRGQPLRLNWPRSAALQEDERDQTKVRTQTDMQLVGGTTDEPARAGGMGSLRSLLEHLPGLDLLLSGDPDAASSRPHRASRAAGDGDGDGDGTSQALIQLEAAHSQRRGLVVGPTGTTAGQGAAFDASKVAPLTTLVVRAHDFGIPLRSATCKVNIHNQALLSRAVSVILNGTAEQLEKRREQLERAFGALTGSRAQIESIDALTDSSSISVARLRLSIPASHSLIDLTDLTALMQALDYKGASPAPGQQLDQQLRGQHYPVHSITTGGRVYPVHSSSNISAPDNQGAFSVLTDLTDVQQFDSASSALERKLLFYIIIVGVCILALLVIWMIYFCCKEDQQQRRAKALDAAAAAAAAAVERRQRRQRLGSSEDSLDERPAHQRKHKKHKSTSKTHLMDGPEDELQGHMMARSASQLNLDETEEQQRRQLEAKTRAKTTLGDGAGSLHPIGSQLAKQHHQLSIPSALKPDHYSMYNGQVWFEQGGLASVKPVTLAAHHKLAAHERRVSSAPSAGANSLDSGLHALMRAAAAARTRALSPAATSGMTTPQPRPAAGQFFPNTLGYAENLATIATPPYMYHTIAGSHRQVLRGHRRPSRSKVGPMTQPAGYTNEAFEQDLESGDAGGGGLVMRAGGARTSSRQEPGRPAARGKFKSRAKPAPSSSCSTASDATQTLDEDDDEQLDRESVLLDSDQELLGFDSTGTPIIATHTRHKAVDSLPAPSSGPAGASPTETVISTSRAGAKAAEEGQQQRVGERPSEEAAQESDNKTEQQRDGAKVESAAAAAAAEDANATSKLKQENRSVDPSGPKLVAGAGGPTSATGAPKGKSQDLMSELNERLSSANRQRALRRQSAGERADESQPKAAAGDAERAEPDAGTLPASGTRAERKLGFSSTATGQRRASETLSCQSTASESGSASTAQEAAGRLRDMNNGDLLEKQSIFALTYSGLATDKLPS